MMRNILIVFFFLGTLVAWAKPEIKIGVVLPLSSSAVGGVAENARDALLLRAAQISSDSRFDYKIFIEDDGYQPRQTALAIQRLLARRVDVLMTLWEPGTNVAMPLLQGKEVLHLSPTRWKSPPDYPYDFVLSGSAESYAQKSVELLQSLGIRRVAAIVAQDNANRYFMGFLQPLLKEHGIDLVDKYECDSQVQDFRPWILRLKQKQPEAVLHNIYMPAAELVLKQMKELGLPTLQVGVGNFFVEVAPEYVRDACYILQYPERNDFLEAFQARYHRAALYPAANYYDALSLVFQVAESHDHKPSAGEFAAAFRGLRNFDGAMGRTSFLPPNRLECELTYYVFKNKKPMVATLEELKKLKAAQ